jgi:hypothetical protein
VPQERRLINPAAQIIVHHALHIALEHLHGDDEIRPSVRKQFRQLRINLMPRHIVV